MMKLKKNLTRQKVDLEGKKFSWRKFITLVYLSELLFLMFYGQRLVGK